LKCQHQYSFQKTFSEPKRDEKIAAVIFLKQLPSPYSKIRVIVKNKPFIFHLLHKYVFFFFVEKKFPLKCEVAYWILSCKAPMSFSKDKPQMISLKYNTKDKNTKNEQHKQ
jgi:hypothetical protein